MRLWRPLATTALLAAGLSGLPACGGDDRKPATAGAVPSYSRGLPLAPIVLGSRRAGTLRVDELTYRAGGGRRVRARLAVSTSSSPLGCLVYQGGLDASRKTFFDLARGLGMLRLATFTVDPPRVGGGVALPRTPTGTRDMLLGAVVHLRSGLDYLESRPECRDNIGLVGTSFGAVVGTMVAAQDSRVAAVVLTSVGSTLKNALLARTTRAGGRSEAPGYVPEVGAGDDDLERAAQILAVADPGRWIGRIAPRPLLLVNGRYDPLVRPADALELAAAADAPKALFYFNGGHDPFAGGPDRRKMLFRVSRFLVENLDLPLPG